MRKPIIGVMGPVKATKDDVKSAYKLGKLIAEKKWILLTGGGNVGVMEAVNRGAESQNGMKIGILPDDDKKKRYEGLDIAIVTNMGFARNVINALTSDVIIACGIGPGTTSEVAYGLRFAKPVVLLGYSRGDVAFLKKIGNTLHVASSPEEAIELTEKLLAKKR